MLSPVNFKNQNRLRGQGPQSQKRTAKLVERTRKPKIERKFVSCALSRPISKRRQRGRHAASARSANHKNTASLPRSPHRRLPLCGLNPPLSGESGRREVEKKSHDPLPGSKKYGQTRRHGISAALFWRKLCLRQRRTSRCQAALECTCLHSKDLA